MYMKKGKQMKAIQLFTFYFSFNKVTIGEGFRQYSVVIFHTVPFYGG